MKDINLFAYTNYRNFLQDFYQLKKLNSKAFTYKLFAEKAGLNSPNYMKLIMDGRRNLTYKNLRGFCEALEFDEKQAEFFKNLVLFNQAKTEKDIIFYQKQMQAVLDLNQKNLLQKDQYGVYASFYTLVIKELILLNFKQQSPKSIAKKLNYALSPEQVKTALKKLEDLNLIKKNSDGDYKSVQQSMQTPNLIKSSRVYDYYQHLLKIASDALKEQSDVERCFSTLTVAVNKQDLPKAFDMIHEFRDHLDKMFIASKKYDAVYQLSIQLFRLDKDDE
ncbi:MAG TPA: TIGR02147 family protein [Oligoflexia bacterium]|nr:TIGR02147 family protein [Oligoflexia bacterium]HMR24601.1 TIGR02147 family protein [Oligoflexia bacterium]